MPDHLPRDWKWLGVRERRWKKSPDEDVQPPKTLWDFLQLLIVPAMLAAIALLFNASQASRERQREDRRVREDRALALETRRDATLDAYLAEMRDLILNRNLLTSTEGSAVQSVARTATLTAVRRLDGRRKGEVIRFLADAGLLSDPTVALEGADLRHANLSHTRLHDLSLDGDLRGARFDDTTLVRVDFSAGYRNADVLSHTPSNGADLQGASFARARLSGVDFNSSNLADTNFGHAFIVGNPRLTALDLLPVLTGYGTGRLRKLARNHPTTFSDACLNNTSFAHASILGADFSDASGRYVDFSHIDNLRSLHLANANFETVRLTAVKRRPEGWPSTGGVVHPVGATATACQRHAPDWVTTMFDVVSPSER